MSLKRSRPDSPVPSGSSSSSSSAASSSSSFSPSSFSASSTKKPKPEPIINQKWKESLDRKIKNFNDSASHDTFERLETDNWKARYQDYETLSSDFDHYQTNVNSRRNHDIQRAKTKVMWLTELMSRIENPNLCNIVIDYGFGYLAIIIETTQKIQLYLDPEKQVYQEHLYPMSSRKVVDNRPFLHSVYMDHLPCDDGYQLLQDTCNFVTTSGEIDVYHVSLDSGLRRSKNESLISIIYEPKIHCPIDEGTDFPQYKIHTIPSCPLLWCGVASDTVFCDPQYLLLWMDISV